MSDYIYNKNQKLNSLNKMFRKLFNLFTKKSQKDGIYMPTNSMREKYFYASKSGKIQKVYKSKDFLVTEDVKEFPEEVMYVGTSLQSSNSTLQKLYDVYSYNGPKLKRFTYYKNTSPGTLYYITELNDFRCKCHRITKDGVVTTTLDPTKVTSYTEVSVNQMTNKEIQLFEIHKAVY